MGSSSSVDVRAEIEELSEALTEGLSEWIKNLQNEGWKVFYVNFMFASLPGNREVVMKTMHDLIETRFYRPLIRQFVHHPTKPSQWKKLPIAILISDLPSYKQSKKHRAKLCDLQINHDGLHVNGFLCTPPVSRLKEEFIQHLEDNYRLYVGGGLDRIFILPVTHKRRVVSGYSVKTVESGRVSYDDWWIFPRELPSRMPKLTDQEKATRDLEARFNVSTETALALLSPRKDKK